MNKEDRIDAIETLLAHQEQQINDLNETVQTQWKEIDALKAKLRLTESKLEDVKESIESGDTGLSSAEAAARDKPPHW